MLAIIRRLFCLLVSCAALAAGAEQAHAQTTVKAGASADIFPVYWVSSCSLGLLT